jgi:flagellar biogenesis protein FliO
MIRTKKFASKPKFRGNKHVRVNKDTGVSERDSLYLTKVAKAVV